MPATLSVTTKAEYLSAVAEGVMILIAALLVLREAITTLPTPHIEDSPVLGIGINVIAAIVNGLWAYALLRVGRRTRSPALQASAHHIFADVLTSAGVVVGIILALATGWLILDPILAILVALNILREGWRVISESVDGLMDASVSGETRSEIEKTIRLEMGDALQFHDLRARSSGAVLFSEFHWLSDVTCRLGKLTKYVTESRTRLKSNSQVRRSPSIWSRTAN